MNLKNIVASWLFEDENGKRRCWHEWKDIAPFDELANFTCQKCGASKPWDLKASDPTTEEQIKLLYFECIQALKDKGELNRFGIYINKLADRYTYASGRDGVKTFNLFTDLDLFFTTLNEYLGDIDE